MTSSISIWIEIPKELSPGPIPKLRLKWAILRLILLLYVETHMFNPFFSTELYRKVRKLPGSQKTFSGTHLKSFWKNSSFLRSNHSTWSYWDVHKLFVVYRMISHVIQSKQNPFLSYHKANSEIERKYISFIMDFKV